MWATGPPNEVSPSRSATPKTSSGEPLDGTPDSRGSVGPATDPRPSPRGQVDPDRPRRPHRERRPRPLAGRLSAPGSPGLLEGDRTQGPRTILPTTAYGPTRG